MNQSQLLSILYDLMLVMGGEIRLYPLLTRTLQRFLFHTGLPAGMVLLQQHDNGPSPLLGPVIGDHQLMARQGESVPELETWVQGDLAALRAEEQALPVLLAGYRFALRLPIPDFGAMVLLGPADYTTELPLTHLFQPVLSNLARAAMLCRNNEAYMARLEQDRDDARQALASSLTQLQSERAQLRTLLDTIPDLVWLKDTQGVFLACNARFERFFGAAEKDILGKTDHDFLLPEQAEFFRANDRKALAADHPVSNQEWVTYADDGHRELLETVKTPMRDGDGQVIGVLGIGRDVTEREARLRELWEWQERMRSAERIAGLGTWQMVPASGEMRWSEGMYALLGLNSDNDEASWAHFLAAIHEEDRPMVMATLAEVQRGRQPGRVTFRVLCPEGRTRHLLTSCVVNGDGESLEMIGASMDMSLQLQAQRVLEDQREYLEELVTERTEQLRQAKDEAIHLARMKSEFLANMSHEIRTPLNGVLGLAQLGRRETSASPEIRETFNRILSSGQLLLGIVNDVLDFSKIEAGKLQIEHLPVNLDHVLEDVVDLMREQAQGKGLKLMMSNALSPAGVCLGDPLRIKQVLLNLLSNAIKFTEWGEVSLSLLRDQDELIFQVRDTGIGMDESALRRIFNPFEQADSSTTRRFGGTGLGLTITYRLVELMQGRIRVESREGFGSCFEVRLPWRPCDASPVTVSLSEPESLSRLEGFAILVAEDNEINQIVIQENLEVEGAQVVMVEHGEAALAAVKAHGPGYFNVVLMDIQMPVMDGYEATRRLKYLDADLPVIGQTANAYGEDRDLCLAAGMVDHIAKPLDPDQMVATILRHARRS